MICDYCAYRGNWEWGLAPHPSKKWVTICPCCRGLFLGPYYYETEDNYDEATASAEY